MIRAMKQKKLEIDVSASGILPGMFVLVAHEDEGIRSFVQRNMLDPLGKQEQSDEFYAIIQMQALIDRWVSCFNPFSPLFVLLAELSLTLVDTITSACSAT